MQPGAVYTHRGVDKGVDANACKKPLKSNVQACRGRATDRCGDAAFAAIGAVPNCVVWAR